MCNTYGTWIQGDSRGWRERHHRRHVEGDYKHPPKEGTFEKLGEHSSKAMKRAAVRLDRELREVALKGVVECMSENGAVVLVGCVDAIHLHVLMQCKDRRPRQRLGWAKLFATKCVKEYLNAHGTAVGLSLKRGEGIWGKRSQCIPIRDGSHRVNALNYIAGHAKKGAVVWVNPEIRRGGGSR